MGSIGEVLNDNRFHQRGVSREVSMVDYRESFPVKSAFIALGGAKNSYIFITFFLRESCEKPSFL